MGGGPVRRETTPGTIERGPGGGNGTGGALFGGGGVSGSGAWASSDRGDTSSPIRSASGAARTITLSGVGAAPSGLTDTGAGGSGDGVAGELPGGCSCAGITCGRGTGRLVRRSLAWARHYLVTGTTPS